MATHLEASDRAPPRDRRGRWLRVLLLLFALPVIAVIGFGAYAWSRFGGDETVVYADAEEHFKYGSTGGEHESGFPYWIFQAMPKVCAQHLPGPGYASLGWVLLAFIVANYATTRSIASAARRWRRPRPRPADRG